MSKPVVVAQNLRKVSERLDQSGKVIRRIEQGGEPKKENK